MQEGLTERITQQENASLKKFADAALKNTARFWFIVAAAGQMLFVFYLIALYGRGAMRGDFGVLNKVMPRGYIPGDTLGNLAIIAHLFFAVFIITGGILQLIPYIRDNYPNFHRWTGRIYVPMAFVMGLSGLYMVWFRGTVGDLSQHLGVSLNGILIMTSAVMTVRYAMAGKFEVHRRWAMRLYLLANGVWFFRVGLMFWILVNGGPAGFDPDTFTGPFLTFWATADSLLPLAILELYFRAQRAETYGKLAMSALLTVLTLAMGAGIVLAFIGMWLPRMG